jgi:hypothetical protein
VPITAIIRNVVPPYLIEKLTTEEKLSGPLTIVLKRLPRILSKGIHTTSSTIDENFMVDVLFGEKEIS